VVCLCKRVMLFLCTTIKVIYSSSTQKKSNSNETQKMAKML
jgi:hypothetical protein